MVIAMAMIFVEWEASQKRSKKIIFKLKCENTSSVSHIQSRNTYIFQTVAFFRRIFHSKLSTTIED